VEPQRLRWELLDAFSLAAQQAGIAATADFNTGNNEGVGYFEVNQRRGVRWNTTKAFLKPAFSRRNLQVWTGAQVSRLKLSRGEGQMLRCEGIELVPSPGAPAGARARKAVVMAAGAIGTPQILELSGIGSAAVLGPLGIAVVHDLQGVGANLQDHLQIRSVYGVQGVRTLNTLAQSWWGKAWIGLQYLINQSGPMSMAPSQLGAFTRSSEAHRWPNVEYHVQPLSLPAFGEPLDPFDALTASVCNLNPTSRGTVHVASCDPKIAPRIQPNYLSTPEDRQVAADSLRLTRRNPRWLATNPKNSSRACNFKAMRTWPAWRAILAPPFFTRWAPAAWVATTTRWPWSARAWRCAACKACTLPTPASCPPSPAATRTRPRS
jgi:choline dehydrogenase